MDSGSIGAAAAVFAVIVVFSMLHRWSPYKPPSESNLPPYEELKRKFLKWEQLSLFSDGGIAINRFLGVGEISYPYSRISAIKSVRHFKAPNGDIKERPYFSIEFDDGERWTTGAGLRDPYPETDRRLVEYVSGKCGKLPQEVDLE